MSKQELLSQIESKVTDLFSNYSLYDNIRKESLQKYENYLQEENKKGNLTLLIDFLDENALKYAISIAMKETINLLVENHLLQVTD